VNSSLTIRGPVVGAGPIGGAAGVTRRPSGVLIVVLVIDRVGGTRVDAKS